MKVEVLLKFLNEMIKKFQEYSKFTQLSECKFSQNGLEIKFLGKSPIYQKKISS